MTNHLTKIIDSNWFFVSLVFFAVVLPFSQALVSIAAGILFFTALAEDSWENKINRIKKNKILLFIPAVFFVYVLSAVISNKLNASFYDLQKSLFFLVIPLAFLFGKHISEIQKRYLFYVFSVSVIISTFVAFLNWKLSNNPVVFNVHKISLISHIRFSFQLILVFWFFVLLLRNNYRNLKTVNAVTPLVIAVYILGFLLFQQSLTGVVALIGSFVFYLFYLTYTIRPKQRIYLIILAILLTVAPVIYVAQTIRQFYDIEIVDINTMDPKTKEGNTYLHDFQNPMVENGKYVFLYVCETEMREEWNKRSELKFDSIGGNGYPVSATLIRYLTSKGLRKDAEGVKALTDNDVQSIKSGIANVVYKSRNHSLYPRIYQTVWEYYTYSATGNANRQSFSQRIEYARAAITIIKQNFWFGVGTGNWKEEFKNAYISNSSQLKEEYYASAHNQYLNYTVKFGIVGFLAIMFFILYPVVQTKRYTDRLFLLFLVFMFFANLADSNFESHMGSSFFVFFYCIFMVGGKNYLMEIHAKNSHNRFNL